MNEAKFAEFSEAYRAGLAEAVEMFPHEYAFPLEKAPEVADKILRKIRENPKGVTYTNSIGFKKACSKLGIKYTVKSIFTFLEI